MLALTEYEAGLCPKCGRHITECTDPKNQGRYEVDLPTRCHATTALLIARGGMDGYQHSDALMMGAKLRA